VRSRYVDGVTTSSAEGGRAVASRLPKPAEGEATANPNDPEPKALTANTQREEASNDSTARRAHPRQQHD
jgi:hypothetical protein